MPAANPIECDYQEAGLDDGAIATFPASTNGIAEYTAPNFGGALIGNLFTAGWNGVISRIVLAPDGASALVVQDFFTGVGGLPLDLTTQAPAQPFAGTIWVADWLTNQIHVWEPSDFDTTPPTYVSHSFDPISGSDTTSVDVTVTAADAGSGMQAIYVAINDAPDNSFTGAWSGQVILGASGTVTFDLTGFGDGTYAVVFDLFDNVGNATHWWDAHADPAQVSAYTLGAPETTPPVYVSHSFTPPSGSTTTSLEVDVSATDVDSGMRAIYVAINDAPDNSFTGAWSGQVILGASGTATFDLTGFGDGTYAVVIDLFDNIGNATHWWDAHADPAQVSAYTLAPP